MKHGKKTKGDLIWTIILYFFFLFQLIYEMVLWHKGELTTYENILFEMIVFGFLITWDRISER